MVPADGAEGLAFLTSLTNRVDTPETREAFVLATMESAYFKLLLGDLDGTKDAIDSSEKILGQLDSVDLVVHASFYRVSGDYYKVSPAWRRCGGGGEARSAVDGS